MMEKHILMLRLEVLKEELQGLRNSEQILISEQTKIIKEKRTNRLLLQGCRAEIREVRQKLHKINRDIM